MVYPDQENPRSRQLPPRIVCRFLPCWYQGEIRVPASFRWDRDQLIFLGIRRSESTEPRALASGRSRLLPRAASGLRKRRIGGRASLRYLAELFLRHSRGEILGQWDFAQVQRV